MRRTPGFNLAGIHENSRAATTSGAQIKLTVTIFQIRKVTLAKIDRHYPRLLVTGTTGGLATNKKVSLLSYYPQPSPP